MNDERGPQGSVAPALSDTAHALVKQGVIAPDAAVLAEQRKQLYGGGLDSALLEIQACDEETLTTHLAEILGIPVAPPATLSLPCDLAVAVWMDAKTAQKLGAIPRAKQGDALEVLVKPEHDHDALVAWAGERALLVEPALVLEVRFRVALHALYGMPVPPRYLALLAKLIGPSAARALVEDRQRGQTPTPTPAIRETDPTETYLAAARLGDPTARRKALHHLSRRLGDPRVVAFRRALEDKAAAADATIACGALRALAELRDKNAVPVVIELLDKGSEEVASVAQATLVALTCEDLGRKARRWTDWWTKMGARSRVEWLLDGLAHRTAEIRLLASSELYEVSGQYFGYHYDLPERDREEARQRWIAWWQSTRGDTT
jgi:hypothetical protein